MADEEQVPPKVGPEIFADDQRAGNEGNAPEAVKPPEVGPEIFSEPTVPDPTDGHAVKNPVGPEVFSEHQLTGVVAEPILSPGEPGAAAQTDVPATSAAQEHADELGVDLTDVKGSGKRGKVLKSDVADAAQ